MKNEDLKMFRFKAWLSDDSGIILVFVLWVIVILTLLTISLGRQSSIDLNLTQNTIERFKARQAAMAGVAWALKEIVKDSKDVETSQRDTRYHCGFRLKENQSPEDVFRNVRVAGGTFDLVYSVRGPDGKTRLGYGFSDEESKINLNALDPKNYSILRELIIGLGYDEELAQIVAASVLDWKDPDDAVTEKAFGAEGDYYESQKAGYPCKNWRFQSLEELLLVRGMTRPLYEDLKERVTIFPETGPFKINLQTASREVLLALAKSKTGAQSNTDAVDAENLVEKIVTYRSGPDGMEASYDDQELDMEDLKLNPKETLVYLLLTQHQTTVAKFLRLDVRGKAEDSSQICRVEAVVNVADLSIVSWARE